MLLNNKVEPFLGPKAYSESEALASFLSHRGARADQLGLFSRTSLINEMNQMAQQYSERSSSIQGKGVESHRHYFVSVKGATYMSIWGTFRCKSHETKYRKRPNR